MTTTTLNLKSLLAKIKCKKTYICKAWEYPHGLKTSGGAYRVTITYKGKQCRFMFFDNSYNCSYKPDFLYCLWLDAGCYEESRDVYDFARQFGYEDMIEARRAYNTCKKQSERLHKLFNGAEIAILSTIE